MRLHLTIAAFLLACCPLANAEDKSVTPVTLMTITTAPQPVPALKYSLLPELTGQIHGNAATAYAPLFEKKADNPLMDETRTKQIAAWRAMDDAAFPRDQVMQFIAEHFQSQLDLLDKAARHSTCEWQYPLEQGSKMQLPGLTQLRSIAYVLSLRIRIATMEGRYDDAVHDLQTGFALARHVATGPTLVNALVGMAIEQSMLQEAERLSQRPDGPNLYWALASLPEPFIDLRPAWNTEREMPALTSPYLRQMAQRKFDPREDPKVSEQKLATALSDLLPGEQPAIQGKIHDLLTAWLPAVRAEALSALIATGMHLQDVEKIPPAQIAAWYGMTQYQSAVDDQLKWILLPFWQAHIGLVACEKRLDDLRQTRSPFLVLTTHSARAVVVSANAKRQVVVSQTIEAIRDYAATHDGKLPADLDSLALPAPADPFTGKPLVYRVSDSTFTLESQIPDDVPAKDGLKYQVTMKAK